ncbi:hypothetical protein L7F22_060915 [Adiantum nelumboides]|nr:hypothetical protein [Adiantum nelumboides]
MVHHKGLTSVTDHYYSVHQHPRPIYCIRCNVTVGLTLSRADKLQALADTLHSLQGGVRPERCVANVIPAVSSVGQIMYVLIEVRDVNGDSFVSHAKLSFALDLRPRVSEKLFSYSLANQENGTFVAAFELYVSGAYELLISLFGTPVKGSPYAFDVVPDMQIWPWPLSFGIFRRI